MPGSNPPETALSEIYEVPFEQPEGVGSGIRAARHGRRQQRRRLDGAVERTARQLRPPQVQGAAQRSDRDRAALPGGLDASMRCPVRTTRAPTDSASADSAYYNFVDRFDMLGMGKDIPLATGNESEGAAGAGRRQVHDASVFPIRWASTAKGLTAGSTIRRLAGRARAVYTTYATRAPFHVRRREGNDEQAGEVPGAPGSAVEVDGKCWGSQAARVPLVTFISWPASERSSRRSRYQDP